jgi:hypothetical protein
MRPNLRRPGRRVWLGGAVATVVAVTLAATMATALAARRPGHGRHHRPGSGPVGQPAPGHSQSPAPAPAPGNGQIGNAPTDPGTPTNPMPPGHQVGVAWDPSKIPSGFAGYGTDLLEKGGMPGPSDVGSFRTVCKYSHMAPDDPIVFPGQSGASHLHVFWGNSLTNANSTSQSLLNTGNGTCRGGTINRTGYWAPALIDTKTGTPIAPDLIHVYYKSGYMGVKPNQINAMPAGLRMVAGDAKATGPQDFSEWKCWDASEMRSNTILSCPQGDFVTMTIDFPQCWDGKNLDSPDHKSHMAYADEGRGCPASHPVAIPVITFNVLYAMPKTGGVSSWRLSSDTYDPKLPGGYSIHGDWFDGWKQDIVNTWIPGCVRKPVSCGSDMLGDGRSMGGDIG